MRSSQSESRGAPVAQGVQSAQGLGAIDLQKTDLTLGVQQRTEIPEVLQPGEIYRLKRGQYGALLHQSEYDRGEFIVVKILSGPDSSGIYKCTTYGEDGKHLGPGGGWSPEYEKQNCHFHRRDLERV